MPRLPDGRYQVGSPWDCKDHWQGELRVKIPDTALRAVSLQGLLRDLTEPGRYGASANEVKRWAEVLGALLGQEPE